MVDPPEVLEPDRLSIPVTAEGIIDVQMMRPGTRERLRRALDPGALAALDIARDAGQGISIAGCRGIYQILSEIEIQIATSRWIGVPADIARQALSFDDSELTELAKPTEAVLSHYSAGWLDAHKDIVELVLILGGQHQHKFARIVRLTAARKAAVAESVATEGTDQVRPSPS